MRRMFIPPAAGLAGLLLAGCATGPRAVAPAERPVALSSRPPTPAVTQASYFAAEGGPPEAKETSVPAVSTNPVGLPELIELALEKHPRLAQVSWAVESARGRAVQAGLYPNPTVEVRGDEINDRTGPGGIWTAPFVSQEIVRGNKLGLSQAVAGKEVDQATLTAVAERLRLLSTVRQNYFEVVVLRRRAEVLGELVGLAEKSVENANKLLQAKEGSELDVVQLEVDLERYRADLDATAKTLPAAVRRLAASVGVSDLPNTVVAPTDLNTWPEYDLDHLKGYVVATHPEIRSAQVGVERAQLALKRAEVEPIPNVTLGAGFTRQNQNKSSDWGVSASIPLPVWNRNQGNIRAARGQVGEAIAEVGRVEADLLGRLANSFATYASARQRAEKYRAGVLPKAERSYQLSLKAYQGGQFEYLRVLQAQRAVGEARLEYLRSVADLWSAVSGISGLTLDDPTPVAPTPPLERKQP